MTTYHVTRGFETVATVSAGTTGTAKSDAADSVRESVREAGGETFESVTAEAIDVYEFPSGPFDPYRITVEGAATVAIESEDEASASETGGQLLEDLLTAAQLDDWEFLDEATVTVAD
ncbi:hypothetical protein BV210_14200 [Halorientalis sp. IM1011]|uniref:hypothetical protein n=1 Tax=Halorientalis sp. IM1011 TaxID=1932360 RepID=UPI00097CCAD0|nr:hypothetical protein [Halorientalis sp. IM1011]AQL43783.1 hypothetical protein BV210_14200 [Halorientalis sp. IM1011]